MINDVISHMINQMIDHTVDHTINHVINYMINHIVNHIIFFNREYTMCYTAEKYFWKNIWYDTKFWWISINIKIIKLWISTA